MKKKNKSLKLNKQTIVQLVGSEGIPPNQVDVPEGTTFPPTKTFTVPSVGTCTCRCV